MRALTHSIRLFAGATAAAVALAACGGSSSGGLYGSGGGGGASNTAAHAATAGRIEAATVQGVGVVLENSDGFTLYQRTTDTAHDSSCTGACAKRWPPLLAAGGGTPSTMGLPGKLSTIERSDGGTQVVYDGMPLYTYSGDTAPGEANGQGIDNVWFAVAPTGSTAAADAGNMNASGPSGGSPGGGSSGGSVGGGYGGGRYGAGGSGGGGNP
jgi:predicted lipoprotein with Yx(FWY)xxD motif